MTTVTMDRWDTAVNRCIAGLKGWCAANSYGGTIPDYMLPHVAAYLMFGEPPEPGDFLEAIIMDRAFSEVVPLADDQNQQAFMTWHRLLHNVFPWQAWRGIGNMETWVNQGGTKGEPLPYLKRYVDGT